MWPLKGKKLSSGQKQTQHHYALAHMVLRELCFDDPLSFFTIMASSKKHEFLDKAWQIVCLHCDNAGKADFSIGEIKIDLFRLDDYPAVLITMPLPQFTTEAYMVLIVLKIPIEELNPHSENVNVGYYTLEKGINAMTGDDQTVLCEWSGESHLYYGTGPEPTPQSFIEAVSHMI